MEYERAKQKEGQIEMEHGNKMKRKLSCDVMTTQLSCDVITTTQAQLSCDVLTNH